MNTSLTVCLFSLILSSCSLAPQYQRPSMAIPERYKESKTETYWVLAKADHSPLKTAPWWESFQDPLLNKLQEQLDTSNQDLQTLFFRYEQARALVVVAQSHFFPTAHGVLGPSRQETSGTIANPNTTTLFNNVVAGSALNYEVDLWGSIRSNVIKNKSLAKASATELAAVSLSLHAELANAYFTLRGQDEAQRILNTNVVAYKKALYLTKQRFYGGASAQEDLDNAQVLLENAKTLAADMHLQRAQTEHAIAVLIGQVASTFSLPPKKIPIRVISISPNIPSTLLERRPDIIAAELKVEAANANIGIARAAFFPSFNLNGMIGFQSQSFNNLFTRPSLTWALGPTAALALLQPLSGLTLFDGGRLLALLKQAKAGYYETVAMYRQTVLKAFQDVEDALVAINQLEKERQTQKMATRSAQKALQQSMYRFKGGIATFLDVVVVENRALDEELKQVTIMTRRQIASVQLIKALGGGLTATAPEHKRKNRH